VYTANVDRQDDDIPDDCNATADDMTVTKDAVTDVNDCSEVDLSNVEHGMSDMCETVAGMTDVNNDSDASSPANANAEALRQEQLDDETLKGWWALAKRDKGGCFIKDGILYHAEKILGQSFSQLCIPKSRRTQVLGLAHDTFGEHLGEERTRERIRLSFTWPTLTSDCKKYCQTCSSCQKRARKTYHDRAPIAPIPRSDLAFSHFFMDTLGPIFNHPVEYNYCLILVDSATRWPAAFPLKSLSAKSVCDALLQLWMVTGICSTLSSDNATNFTSKLNRELLTRIGCSPRLNTPGHAQSSGLVERMVGTVKNMINKVAYDHPKQWHKYLGYILWALREVPNETTGVPPWVMAFGYLLRGPLAVLKESWVGDADLPLDLGKKCGKLLARFARQTQGNTTVCHITRGACPSKIYFSV